jgi:CIC family chloride channel protein
MAARDESTSFKKTLTIAIVVGVISGFGAWLFFQGLKLGVRFFMGTLLDYQMPLEGESMQQIALWAPPPHMWLIIPIICFGGLLSGILVYRFAPEAAGHGTDAAIKAFHGDGRVRWRIPLLKAVTSILTISTGGSAGREGPTAQISAGFGSIAADMLGMSARERRIAIATGIGAGIGTIFKAPLGGAILAGEILYLRDFESDAILPAFLASIIGYSIFGTFEGFDPVFGTAGITWSVSQIPLYLLLGICCAAIGLLYVWTFYRTNSIFNEFFTKHGLPPHFKPLTGAFFVGLIVVGCAYLFPQGYILGLASMGTGYGFVQLAIYSMLPLTVLLFLPFFKILTTSLTIGSGGSGGVFAPGLVIGGAAGGAIGTILHLLLPGIVPITSVPAFVVVGMIALFGSISHAPIAVMIMVVEMTGDFSMLVPSMGAVAIATVLTGNKTIYREQVMNKASSHAHRGEYLVEVLQEIRTGDVMTPFERLKYLTPRDKCRSVIRLIDETTHTGFPVIEDEHLLGIVTIGDIRNLRAKGGEVAEIRNCMTVALITVTPDDDLETALNLMISHEIHHLPVVAEEKSDKIVGFLTTTDIMQAYSHKVASIQNGDE